jgi:hypothetical protein
VKIVVPVSDFAGTEVWVCFRAASHKGGRQENYPRGHKMIGRSFQEGFTCISINRSSHKHGGMRRNHMWLLMDEKKSYVACIGLPLASNDYRGGFCVEVERQ